MILAKPQPTRPFRVAAADVVKFVSMATLKPSIYHKLVKGSMAQAATPKFGGDLFFGAMTK